jgi:phosphonate transport system substrate-binding protein
VRKDSGITKLEDLKGQTICFPAPTAVAATMMPKLFLKERGLDVEKDAQPMYVGSQDSVILNVFHKRAKAGCTWTAQWEVFLRDHPEVGAEVVVQWRTEPLMSNSFMVRDDVPETHVQRVRELLVNLHTHEAGQAILARINVPRIDAADSATYQPVRDFLKKYREAIGPLPEVK